MFRNLLLVSAVGFTTPAMAQYPKIPQDVQKWADSLMNAERTQSDAAWAKALPIIIQEAKQGKPYIPWAARPYDLPQAGIVAFPGAEGGGAGVRHHCGRDGFRTPDAEARDGPASSDVRLQAVDRLELSRNWPPIWQQRSYNGDARGQEDQ